MKIRPDLDDDPVRAVEREAAETDRTTPAVVEDRLRESLRRRPRFRLRLPTVRGQGQPEVDLADRDSLIDLMEGRSERPPSGG